MTGLDLFTLSEVAELLRIDRRRLDRLARVRVVLPVYHSGRHGDSTLYRLADVVLLAVVLRLEREGVSYVGRCVFASKYGDVIRAAVASGASVEIGSDYLGPRVLDDGTVGTVAFRFQLRPIAEDVARRAKALRAEKLGELRAGWRSVPVEDVAAELAIA